MMPGRHDTAQIASDGAARLLTLAMLAVLVALRPDSWRDIARVYRQRRPAGYRSDLAAGAGRDPAHAAAGPPQGAHASADPAAGRGDGNAAAGRAAHSHRTRSCAGGRRPGGVHRPRERAVPLRLRHPDLDAHNMPRACVPTSTAERTRRTPRSTGCIARPGRCA